MIWCPPILVDTLCLSAPRFRRCAEIRAYLRSAIKRPAQNCCLGELVRDAEEFRRILITSHLLLMNDWKLRFPLLEGTTHHLNTAR